MPSPPLIAAVAMPETPLMLGASPVSLRLTQAEDQATAQRLVAATQSETESVLLQLRCVDADRQPGAIWEAYVGLPPEVEPNAESPHFVGTVALVSDGVRSEQNSAPFAEFVFVLDRAIAASPDASQLNVILVPSSGVSVDGQAAPPQVGAPIRIGEMSLRLGQAQPAP
jgi:hypothetical protein